MGSASKREFEAALQLSESERLELAEKLIESMAHDIVGLSMDDPILVAELDRMYANQEGAIPWSQLRTELDPSSGQIDNQPRLRDNR